MKVSNNSMQKNMIRDFLLRAEVSSLDDILKNLGELYDADRVCVLEDNHGIDIATTTHEWCVNGVMPKSNNQHNLTIGDIKAIEDVVKNGEYVIQSLEDELGSDDPIYQVLYPQHIHSLILAPLILDDQISGYIEVDNPRANLDKSLILLVISSVICTKILTQRNLDKNTGTKNLALSEMRDIIGAAEMGTWRIIFVDGKLPRFLADERMLELLGLEGQKLTPEAIYDKWFSNIKPEAVQSVLDSVERMKEGNRDENTYIWIHPTLGERYVRCGGTARPITNGFVLSGYHYDVDEIVREQMKQATLLKEALAAAERANHAKTTFLNNMSHDIRTPMNAIIGYTTLATSHIDNKGKLQDYLSKIKTSSEHLLSLINDVLDMSRIESGRVTIDEKETHLPDILQDIITITQASVNAKHLSFFIDTASVIHEDIICDKLRLAQVLLNMLSNATKFTRSGGAISMRVIERSSKLARHANYEFHIKDNGIGISEEFREHIFEPFTREKTSTVSGIPGTGLGMAISKNIIDMMGGTIEVISKENVGTEFIVRVDFKIIDRDAEQQDFPKLQGIGIATIGDSKECDFTGKSILLVEDNKLNQEIAEEFLKQYGFNVAIANDGDEAVEIMSNAIPKQFDMILMDIQMPRLNGYDATILIRQLPNGEIANTPIIAMTANAFEEDRTLAIQAGMDGYIAKPIDVDKLMETIKSNLK